MCNLCYYCYMAVKYKNQTYLSPSESARALGRTPNHLHVHLMRDKIKSKEVPVPRRMVPLSEVVRILKEEGREDEAQAIEQQYAEASR